MWYVNWDVIVLSRTDLSSLSVTFSADGDGLSNIPKIFRFLNLATKLINKFWIYFQEIEFKDELYASTAHDFNKFGRIECLTTLKTWTWFTFNDDESNKLCRMYSRYFFVSVTCQQYRHNDTYVNNVSECCQNDNLHACYSTIFRCQARNQCMHSFYLLMLKSICPFLSFSLCSLFTIRINGIAIHFSIDSLWMY